MPELPEVETVVRDLRPLLVGRRVVRVSAGHQRLRQPWRPEWAARLKGRRFEAVTRRGKWIVLELDSGARLVVHLGMTGQLTVAAPGEAVLDHTHLVFGLDDKHELRYRDIRRFGGATLFASSADVEAFFLDSGLGPEPFTLDPGVWCDALAATSRQIKAVLLDQTVVAGVGNIYADEALFDAKLHPTRRANELTRPEADRLRKAVASVLTYAIEKRGSTIRNYVGGSGLAGGYQDEFRAYGRRGEPCRRCRTPLEVLRVGGRASHYCPSCQPSAISCQQAGRPADS
ncbi:MAG: bifunctional DNA-formamidopyrimidine glycosylase/DNA-(apurinic or apyrimidinic site) lyase [Gemmataceae bacterium]